MIPYLLTKVNKKTVDYQNPLRNNCGHKEEGGR
jgi:hypothetical protein